MLVWGLIDQGAHEDEVEDTLGIPAHHLVPINPSGARGRYAPQHQYLKVTSTKIHTASDQDKKRLLRWVRITKEFLPPNEQALRAREQLRGEAELEFEEVDDSRFDHADGIDRLLQDFSESFGEKEFFRQGGAIREFEAMGRLQGESITAFVHRLRLLERKLLDSRVPTYPEQARVIKLLDGMRLDERSTSSLLLAAGNRYEMKPILDAIWLHYPAGMSVTGLPLRAAAASSRKVSQKQRSKRSWHTDWHDGAGEDEETYGPEANEVHDDEAVTQTESDDVEYHDEEPEAGSAAVEDIWPLLHP